MKNKDSTRTDAGGNFAYPACASQATPAPLAA
jgi:hypothetical protein